MEFFVILFIIGLLVSPIIVVLLIFGRLSALSRRIDENFAADQADKLVLKRALERLRQLEETVQCLSTRSAEGAVAGERPRSTSRAAGPVSATAAPTSPLGSPSPEPSLGPSPDGAPAGSLEFLRAGDAPTAASAAMAATPRERVTLAFPDTPTGTHPESSPETGIAATAESAQLQEAAPPGKNATRASRPKPASPATPRPLPPTAPTPETPAFEWEALIGGNILNKLGAFILVIGLALFLYYSLDAFGPFVKLLIGILAGAGLLVAGTVAERAGSSPIFVRGLFGAGWSAVYFTTYAAHGLPVTRVIDDPIVSVSLLMAVAAGMVAHSLKFASEATSGLAFFIAFCGLVVGPAGRFTTFAAVLLSAALLGLSFRYGWSGLVIFGTVAAYGFQAFHPAYPLAGAGFGVLLFNQFLLIAYWLGFESFGIVQPSRTATSSTRRAALFLLNAIGFVLVSYLLWPESQQAYQYWLWGGVTALYFGSGLLRHSLFKALPADETEFEAAWAPSPDSVYCLAAAAGLMLAWSALPASLVAIGWGILCLVSLEAGLHWKFPNLANMGHLCGVLAFGRLFISNFTLEGHTSGISHRLLTVMPMVVLYFQVFARCSGEGQTDAVSDRPSTAIRAYLYCPVILLVALARFELGRGLATPAWASIALGLQIIGVFWQIVDFRRQSVLLAVLTALHAWGTDLRGLEASGAFAEPPFIGILTILALFTSQAVAPREALHRVQGFEGAPTGIGAFLENQGRLVFSLTASFVLAFLLYLKISGSLLSLAWAATGALLLVSGFLLREKPSRYTGLVLMAICLVKLFFYDLQYLEVPFRILSFVILGLILMGISWAYTRFQDKLREYL